VSVCVVVCVMERVSQRKTNAPPQVKSEEERRERGGRIVCDVMEEERDGEMCEGRMTGTSVSCKWENDKVEHSD